MAGSRTLQSLDTGLRVLFCLAREPGEWGTAELSRELEIPKSVVHSVLATLRLHGLAEQDRVSRRYRLGPRSLELGRAAVSRNDLRLVARPVMQRLAAVTDESAYLVVPLGGEGVLLERADPANPIRVTMEVGSRGPLHAGAAFKVILAHLPDDTVRDILNRQGLPPVGPKTPSSVAELMDQLEAIRRLGYSYTEEETFKGVAGVAAAVFDATGQVVASLSLAGLIPRFRHRLERLRDDVTSAAATISERLGHQSGGRAHGPPGPHRQAGD